MLINEKTDEAGWQYGGVTLWLACLTGSGFSASHVWRHRPRRFRDWTRRRTWVHKSAAKKLLEQQVRCSSSYNLRALKSLV